MNQPDYLIYLLWLLPEVIVVGTALAILIADMLLPESRGRQLIWTLAGIAAAILVDILCVLPMTLDPELKGTVPPLVLIGLWPSFVKYAILAATALTAVLFHQRKSICTLHPGEFLALLLFSTSGMMFLVSADDLLLVLLSMEFIGIVSYLLVSYVRMDSKACEGAVKFFLVGAFASAIMVYGISFIYGALGTTSIQGIGKELGRFYLGQEAIPPILKIGVLFLLVGFGFKLAMVPFHSWLPDAMEGASAPVAGFISVAPKAAGLAVLIRIFTESFPLARSSLAQLLEGANEASMAVPAAMWPIQMAWLLSILAAVTMCAGNLMAIHQSNIKRLLAYSSIAHIGYILIGVIASNPLGASGVLVYIVAYVLMNLGAFACVVAVANRLGSDNIEDYAGLSRRSLSMALLLSLFLLSLGGIPPTAGFIGKYLVFMAAIQAAQAQAQPWLTPYPWLTILGVLNTVVSIYYYFRVVHQMFFEAPVEETGVEGSRVLWVGAGIAAALILLIGIFPGALANLAGTAARSVFSLAFSDSFVFTIGFLGILS